MFPRPGLVPKELHGHMSHIHCGWNNPLSIGLVILKGRRKAAATTTIVAPKPENGKDNLWAVKVARDVPVAPSPMTLEPPAVTVQL